MRGIKLIGGFKGGRKHYPFGKVRKNLIHAVSIEMYLTGIKFYVSSLCSNIEIICAKIFAQLLFIKENGYRVTMYVIKICCKR